MDQLKDIICLNLDRLWRGKGYFFKANLSTAPYTSITFNLLYTLHEKDSNGSRESVARMYHLSALGRGGGGGGVEEHGELKVHCDRALSYASVTHVSGDSDGCGMES